MFCFPEPKFSWPSHSWEATMELLVAPVEHITFDIEVFLLMLWKMRYWCWRCCNWGFDADVVIAIKVTACPRAVHDRIFDFECISAMLGQFLYTLMTWMLFLFIFCPRCSNFNSITVAKFTPDSQVALSQQLGAQPLPFPGMDKSGAAVCEFYVRTHYSTICWYCFPL